MKRDSVDTRLKNLTHFTSLPPSSKERIRRNLDLEIERFTTDQLVKQRGSLKRRLATTMSVVAPVLILLMGYQLWSGSLGETLSRVQTVTPISPTELVAPSTMPAGVSNVPTVTLNYTDHSDYQYTLEYQGKSAGTRFLIQEGSMRSTELTTPPHVTWKIRGVSVQVFQPERSRFDALFSYAGRHYNVTASESSLTALKRVVISLVDSAIKRG